MPNQTAIPEPLYIADKGERLIDMLVDVMFDRLITEVETEEQEKQNNP